VIKWIVILFIVAIVAGALGFRGVAGAASKLAFLLIAVGLAFIAIMLLLFAWAGGGLL
jgi:uncharacterized membrane protein YtjA (UPF0391 family)